MTDSALSAGSTAVVTGAASGIGLAACKRFAALGMKVCMADIAKDELEVAAKQVAQIASGGDKDVLAVPTDVASVEGVGALKEAACGAFGNIELLMNNAVIRLGGGTRENYAQWRAAMDVNLWGVVHGVQAFVAAMIEQGSKAFVVNVGSKQGITNPPGNAAYNATKAALKSYTESLQHELRNTENCRVSAHLLIPGWTTTGKREHKQGAWLPDRVIDVMLAALQRGDFYIMCRDDEVTPEMDRQRILWAAGDIVENRPPLSRWHPDYGQAFKDFSSR